MHIIYFVENRSLYECFKNYLYTYYTYMQGMKSKMSRNFASLRRCETFVVENIRDEVKFKPFYFSSQHKHFVGVESEQKIRNLV